MTTKIKTAQLRTYLKREQKEPKRPALLYFRVSKNEKAGMDAVAHSMGISTASYIRKLHLRAVGQEVFEA